MTVIVRRGRPEDAPALQSLDTVVPTDPRRAASIEGWLAHDIVLVAEAAGVPVGYTVLDHSFFRQGDVGMLMLHPDWRGRRIGEQLLRGLEQVCDTPKLFCTTNLSNQRMQGLLVRLGYAACGFIDELDPGDPELVYVKKLGKPP